MKDIYESPYYREFEYSCARFYQTKDRYKEILRLQKMLEENGIPHVFGKAYDGWMVCYPVARRSQNCVLDAIEHAHSYGNWEDRLEIMGLLTPEEEAVDDVVGHLTAENVFERIKKHWEENKNERT